MDKDQLTKLKVRSGSFELRFEGSEAFLRSEVPKLVKAVDDLHASSVSIAAGILNKDLEQSLQSKADLDKEIEGLKNDLDSMSEMGEMESLRLQMAMERVSKAMSALSNVLKKMSDTASGIIQNLK